MTKLLYLQSINCGTEFFRISTERTLQTVERLQVNEFDRAELSDAVSPHGHFTSLSKLLAPFTHHWAGIGSGTKKQVGDTINRFAMQNPKLRPAMVTVA